MAPLALSCSVSGTGPDDLPYFLRELRAAMRSPTANRILELLFHLEVVEEEAVRTEAVSSRAAVTWEVRVRVNHLVHEELFPKLLRRREPLDSISWDPQRIHQFLFGAAYERFLRYLDRVAVNTSAEWLILNLDPSPYVFLFSTRAQPSIAERLGVEAGLFLSREEQRFHVVTERRVPPDRCYCFHAGAHRVFARIVAEESSLRLYLSDVIRTAPGHSIVQLTAEEGIRFLRAMTRPAHGEEAELEPPPMTAPRTRSQASAPARIARRSPPPQRSDPSSKASSSSLPVDGRCPACGDRLLYLSAREAICLSCDWSNLTPLGG